MAKSRRNRARGGQRADPIAKPVKPPADPELAAIREKSILPVVKNLQSADPKSRTAAASAVANIVQDTKCRKLLLREQIVRIVMTETLTDSSLESRAAGWEILRVITSEEEADFGVHLYRVDILTAIQHAAAKITEALISTEAPFDKKTKAEQIFTWRIAEAITELIAAVAAAQDEALDAASRSQEILQFLFTVISVESITAAVMRSTLSCMITLSEDNRHFADAVLNDGLTRSYKRLVAFSNGESFQAALACGVLHNLFSALDWNDRTRGRDGACDAVLVPTLAQILAHTLQRFGSSDSMITSRDSTSAADVLQVALEVLASIGTTLQDSFGKSSRGKKAARQGGKQKEEQEEEDDDDAMDADENSDAGDGNDDEEEEDEEEEGEGASDDDEMGEDEILADMDMVTGADDDNEGSGINDLPTLAQLIHGAIPEAVNLFQNIRGEDEVSTLIRTHTLTVLSNIAWTVSCIDFSEGANEAILKEWTPAAQFIWKNTVAPVLASNTSDIGLATVVTSLAWAISRTLSDKSFLTGDEHQKFISLYHASKSLDANPEDPFQGLGVKCIGVLGQLAMDPAPLALNREIGVFLVTVVASLPETPAAEVVEALNQLFDIYGDENSANDKEVFWKDNFLQHIEATVQKVKAMVKTVDKRKSTELRARAEEVSLNLTRFIQYKQKHRP